MKKILKYLEWLPFAISLGSIVIYIVYTIQLKLNPAIIVTDNLLNNLKTYLILSLVALFVGLLIILIKKIYRLMKTDTYIEKTVTTKTINPINNTKVVEETTTKTVVAEDIKEDVIKVVEKEPIIETKETIIKKEPIVEKTIVKEEPIIEKTIVEETPIVNIENKVLCPDCNNIISRDAALCPRCGILFDDEIIKILEKYDKKKYKPKKSRFVTIANICLTILFIILIFLICNMLYNKYNQNIKNVTSIIQRQ